MATDKTSDGKTALGDDVSIELLAPYGWTKKVTPKKGVTPGRNEVVFVAPDGEEIKNKTQLKSYLKSNSTGFTVKEFDWSAGDTPRRSARLGEKSKVSESPENTAPKKRHRKLISKELTKEIDDASDGEATSEGTKAAIEDSNADAQDTVEQDQTEVVTEKALPEKVGSKDPVERRAVGEPAAEEEKAADKEQEAAAEEQNTDAKEQGVAAEVEKTDAKEQEVAAEEQGAVAEERMATDEKMDVQLGTNDNEAADIVEEGNQVSDSKQSNGEEGVENISLPSAVSSEEVSKAENVPSDAEVVVNVTTTTSHDADMFLDAVGDEEVDAKAEDSADKLEQPKNTSDPKVETADKKDDSLTEDEAVGKDAPMQEAGEENRDLPS